MLVQIISTKLWIVNKKDFNETDIEDALDEYIKSHNNSVKRSTKYSLNEIRDLSDPILIENILINLIKSFKKYFIEKDEIIDTDEKLLMWDNVILKNSIYIKNMKDKNGNFTIHCIFKDYKNTEIIEVIIK